MGAFAGTAGFTIGVEGLAPEPSQTGAAFEAAGGDEFVELLPGVDDVSPETVTLPVPEPLTAGAGLLDEFVEGLLLEAASVVLFVEFGESPVTDVTPLQPFPSARTAPEPGIKIRTDKAIQEGA